MPTQHGRRGLQQGSTPLTVHNPEELVEAISTGEIHIVIVEHLDLTGLDLRSNPACPEGEDGCGSPLPALRETQSIRGRCSEPPSDKLRRVIRRTRGARELIEFHFEQCLLLAHEDTLPLIGPRHWVDNLYIRVAVNPEANRQLLSVGLLSVPRLKDKVSYAEPGVAVRYITRTTLQGDGVGPSVGIWAHEDTYMEQCTFVNLGGRGVDSELECDECSAAINVQSSASIHVVNSTFFDLMREPASRYVRVWDNDTAVLLSGCRFDGATDAFQQRDAALIYSDNSSLRIETDARLCVPPQPPSSIPAVPEGEPPVFQPRDQQWFVGVYKELTGGDSLPLQAAPKLQPPVPEVEPLPPAGPDAPVVALSVVAAALVLLAAVAAALWWRRRQRRRAAVCGDSDTSKPTAEQLQSTSSLILGAGLFGESVGTHGKPGPWSTSSYTVSERSSRASRPRSSTATASAFQPIDRHTASGVGDTIGEMDTEFDATEPADGANVRAKLDFLQHQLNCFGRNDVILERFSLLGPMHRRQGGQGVVAFARGAYDDLEYALKFFVHRASFLAERDMYRCQALSRLLPRVYCDYDPEEMPGVLCDLRGRPLPACLVMERGEGLADWSRRAKPDVFQSVAVLAHVAMRLRDLHAEGYVHRDVKPENIMLLPRENTWTVIDFGCTALAGMEAPLSYTLVYSAPEVAAAAAAGAKTIVAQPAMDAWALGIVAYELLTRQSAFSLLTEGRESVLAKLRGDMELAWEGDLNEKNPTARRRLGLFREPVLALLHRNPEERASLSEFCRTVNSVFSSPTTIAATTEPLKR